MKVLSRAIIMARMMTRTFTALAGILLAVGCTELRAQDAAPNSSISPDGRWKYECRPFGNLGQCAPTLTKAGSDDVEVDLDDELGISGPYAERARVVWAPDSRRFACNYSPPHPHSATVNQVAFYQFKGDKWERLESPTDDASSRLQLAQLGKGRLPKGFKLAQCDDNQDELKATKWLDPSRVVVYAPCYGTDVEEQAGFLFTLKFDNAGKWKVVATHRMSNKELDETGR